MPYRPKPHRPPVMSVPRHLRRGSASQCGYGAHWRRLRMYVLVRQPLCADPFGHHAADNRLVPASQVDHIVPRADGGTDAEDNLQALCETCHARKTALHDGGFGRVKRQMGRTDGNAGMVRE